MTDSGNHADSSGSSSGGDTGTGGDATSDGGGGCMGTATGATQASIDDESAPTGTQITFSPTLSPPACASKGTWFDYNSGSGDGGTGNITPSPFVFSALPAGLPADAGVPVIEAGVSEAGLTDAASDAATAASGPMAACIKGATGSTQYNTSGMGLNFATVANPDGGNATPTPIDASTYTGVQFWIYGGSATSQSIIVQAADKQETAGLGVCDNTVTGHECGGATAPVTVASGWQLIKVPFAMFAINANYGGLNETTIDTKTLTQLQFQIQEGVPADAGVGTPFNFCVYRPSFY